MVYFGHIKNGQVVPDQDVNLPEGSRVRIEPLRTDADPADDLSAEAIDTGLPDLAEQHNHYARGIPKRPEQR